MLEEILEDPFLSHYSLRMQEEICDDVYTIQFKHQFLPLEEEARMEHVSLFFDHELSNEQAIQMLLSSSSHSINDVVIASCGTSTTQVYSKKFGVLCTFYIGTDTMALDPERANTLTESILLRMIEEKEKDDTFPSTLIFINSISFLTTENLVFPLLCENEEMAKTIIRENVNVFNLNAETILFNIHSKALSFAAATEIIIMAKKPKMKKIQNDWLEVKVQEILREEEEKSFFIVDYGGGGPELFFHTGRGGVLQKAEIHDTIVGGVVKKNSLRILRGKQQEFVQEMKMMKYEESMIFQEIRRWLLDMSLSFLCENEVKSGKYCVFIFQTGFAREISFRA